MKKIALRSIQFQGANGFPMALYRPAITQIKRKVLTILDKKGYEVENASSFTIGGCDLFPHVHTGTDWTAMVDELACLVETRSDGTGPLICIGHSFGGGVLSALAARRPELVHRIILVDPPLFRVSKRLVFAFLKRIVTRGMAEKYHPVIEGTLRKKDVFKSRSEAREHLSKRRVFSTMDPAVFDIFIDECLVPYNDAANAINTVTVTDTDTNASMVQHKDKHTHKQTHSTPNSDTIEDGGAVTLFLSKEDEAEVYHRVPYEIPILSPDILNQYGMSTPGKIYFTHHKNSILEVADQKWLAKTFTNTFLAIRKCG